MKRNTTSQDLESTNESKFSSETSDPSIENLLRMPGKLANRGCGLNAYDPGLPIINRSLAKVKPGVVLKFPHYPWWLFTPEQVKQLYYPKDVETSKAKFERERRVFEILGDHPRIVRYVSTHARVTVTNLIFQLPRHFRRASLNYPRRSESW